MNKDRIEKIFWKFLKDNQLEDGVKNLYQTFDNYCNVVIKLNQIKKALTGIFDSGQCLGDSSTGPFSGIVNPSSTMQLSGFDEELEKLNTTNNYLFEALEQLSQKQLNKLAVEGLTHPQQLVRDVFKYLLKKE